MLLFACLLVKKTFVRGNFEGDGLLVGGKGFALVWLGLSLLLDNHNLLLLVILVEKQVVIVEATRFFFVVTFAVLATRPPMQS